MPTEDLIAALKPPSVAYTLLSDNPSLLLIPGTYEMATTLVTSALLNMTSFEVIDTAIDSANVETAKRMLMSSISPFLPLDIVKTTSKKDFAMPTSKGVGSDGEVVHLVGSKNELITVHFFTNRLPGILRNVVPKIIDFAMSNAVTVYLVDDIFSVTPCLIKGREIENRGMLKGAIVGEITLMVLTKSKRILSKEHFSRLLAGALVYGGYDSAVIGSFATSGGEITTAASSIAGSKLSRAKMRKLSITLGSILRG